MSTGQVTRLPQIRRDPRHRVSMLVNDWTRIQRVLVAARKAADESLQHDYEPTSARDGDFACAVCGQEADEKHRHIRTYGAHMAELFAALKDMGEFEQ